MFSGRIVSRFPSLSSVSSRCCVSSSFSSVSSVPVRYFSRSTSNNPGSYAANSVPLSSTSNPEPNRPSSAAASGLSASPVSGLSSSTVRVGEKLKDAYSGLKDKVSAAMSSGSEAMDKGREMMDSTRSGMGEKLSNMANKVGEGGLGPVVGAEKSIEGIDAADAPGRIKTTQEAGVGIPTQAIDTANNGSPFNNADAPLTGKMNTVQPQVDSSKRQMSDANRSAASREAGVSDTATEHAAQVQRKQGMSSNDLLGSQALKEKTGTNPKHAKAPQPENGSSSKGSQASR